jgi:hypothetical protein
MMDPREEGAAGKDVDGLHAADGQVAGMRREIVVFRTWAEL